MSPWSVDVSLLKDRCISQNLLHSYDSNQNGYTFVICYNQSYQIKNYKQISKIQISSKLLFFSSDEIQNTKICHKICSTILSRVRYSHFKCTCFQDFDLEILSVQIVFKSITCLVCKNKRREQEHWKGGTVNQVRQWREKREREYREEFVEWLKLKWSVWMNSCFSPLACHYYLQMVPRS